MTTKISYVDEVWNPVTGCSPISEGCKNCYAARIAKRFWGERPFSDVQCHPERLDIPMHWKKPRRILVPSMGDLFHEKIPENFIDKVFWTMTSTFTHAHAHTYLLLTKRPDRIPKEKWHPWKNIWLGVTVENNDNLWRVEELLKIDAAVKWVSVEPMLERIQFGMSGIPGSLMADTPDWVVCGGESGPGRRPFNIEWARDLRDQCKAAGVPYYMKQIDGKQPIPEDLMIREMPDA